MVALPPILAANWLLTILLMLAFPPIEASRLAILELVILPSLVTVNLLELLSVSLSIVALPFAVAVRALILELVIVASLPAVRFVDLLPVSLLIVTLPPTLAVNWLLTRLLIEVSPVTSASRLAILESLILA